MIELTKIVSERGHAGSDEDDMLPMQPEVITVPVMINPAAIRCYYARKDNRPGTRITFTDGGGFVVTEGYALVKAALAGIGFVN